MSTCTPATSAFSFRREWSLVVLQPQWHIQRSSYCSQS